MLPQVKTEWIVSATPFHDILSGHLTRPITKIHCTVIGSMYQDVNVLFEDKRLKKGKLSAFIPPIALYEAATAECWKDPDKSKYYEFMQQQNKGSQKKPVLTTRHGRRITTTPNYEEPETDLEEVHALPAQTPPPTPIPTVPTPTPASEVVVPTPVLPKRPVGRPRKRPLPDVTNNPPVPKESTQPGRHADNPSWLSGVGDVNGVKTSYTLSSVPKSFVESYMAHPTARRKVSTRLKSMLNHNDANSDAQQTIEPKRYVPTTAKRSPSLDPVPVPTSSPTEGTESGAKSRDDGVTKHVCLDLPDLNLKQLYDEARKVYAAHDYHIPPSTVNRNFFTSKPFRIFQAIISPHIILSIVKSTNKYADVMLQKKFTPVTLDEIFLYISTMAESYSLRLNRIQTYYDVSKFPPAMSKRRFDFITRFLQFNTYFLGLKSDVTPSVTESTQLVATIKLIRTQYSTWIMKLFPSIPCVVIDDYRIGFKKSKPPRSAVRSSLIAKPSPSRKPQPYGIQFHTCHEAHTKLWLSFLPTVKDSVEKIVVAQKVSRASTMILELLDTLKQAGLESLPRVLGDGWYGSLEVARRLNTTCDAYILRINKNPQLIPSVPLEEIPVERDEYVHYGLEYKDFTGVFTTNLIRTGFGKSNVVITDLAPDDQEANSDVNCINDGHEIDMNPTRPHALYKLYGNASDTVNSYLSHATLHTLVPTRIFKTRLYHYFINLFVVQARLIYNAIHPLRNIPDQFRRTVGNPRKFYKLFGQSIRHSLFYEHHYTVSARLNIQREHLIQCIKNNDYYSYLEFGRADENSPQAPTCSYARTGFSHGPAVAFCVACAAHSSSSHSSGYCCANCLKHTHTWNKLARK